MLRAKLFELRQELQRLCGHANQLVRTESLPKRNRKRSGSIPRRHRKLPSARQWCWQLGLQSKQGSKHEYLHARLFAHLCRALLQGAHVHRHLLCHCCWHFSSHLCWICYLVFYDPKECVLVFFII